MTLLDITERAEVLRTNANRVVEAQRAQTKSWFVRFMAMIGLSATAIIAIMLYGNQRIENRISEGIEPAPAVVRLAVAPVRENPLLCPGDTLPYLLTLDVTEPSVVAIDWNIKNLDTNRTEIQSETVRAIYDEPGVVSVQGNWKLPAKLPPTNTRPERNWTPGQYRRLIAFTGVEGSKRASVVKIDFRVSDSCLGAGK